MVMQCWLVPDHWTYRSLTVRSRFSDKRRIKTLDKKMSEDHSRSYDAYSRENQVGPWDPPNFEKFPFLPKKYPLRM